jgi:N-methylhydantoinase A
VDAAATDPGHRIWWRDGWVDAPVYARSRLRSGHVVSGPAVVAQEDSTTLVHPGSRAKVDRYGNLLLERA